MSLAQIVTQLTPSCTDHELVDAVRAGGERAFEELYGRYVTRVRSYVYGMVRDHGRAEDITQDVFIAALRRLHATDGFIAFKPWIYEIARNACIDDFRRRRRAQEVSLESSENSVGPAERLLSSAPAPDAAVETKQRLDDLRGAFGGLSETHHRIMVMRELEGLSLEQIGARMDMSKPGVESTLFRARRRLHAEYDELVSGRRCEQVQTMIVAGDERPIRSLGLRQRGQLARHLAHCQPCRRTARMAGLDESLFHAPGLIGKIAALLPFPWLRLRRSTKAEESVMSAGAHTVSLGRPLQALAQLGDPSGPLAGLGRAGTAAAAALVLAGAGGGVLAGVGAQHQASHGASSPPGIQAGSLPTARATSRTVATAAQSSNGGSPGGRSSGSTSQTGASGGGSGAERYVRGPGTAAAPGAAGPAAERPAASTGPASAVQSPATKLGQAVGSATGLLGGSSASPLKLPSAGLPTVKSVASALDQIKAALRPVAVPATPKLQLPLVAQPDPATVVRPNGRQ